MYITLYSLSYPNGKGMRLDYLEATPPVDLGYIQGQNVVQVASFEHLANSMIILN